MKKIRWAMTVVLLLTILAGCDLSTPLSDGGSVSGDVELAGLPMAAAAGSKILTGNGTVSWVKIRVTNSSGTQVGYGTLTQSGDSWAGGISVSETGTLTFTASAGATVDSADRVYYSGNTNSTVSGSGFTVTIAAAAPSASGGRGPAGGYIFYDKGSYSNGWRYLEAAPADMASTSAWSNVSGTLVGTTSTALGAGKTNTAAIIAQSGHTASAAKICDDYSYGGYDDWFLPSITELRSMYNAIGSTDAICASYGFSEQRRRLLLELLGDRGQRREVYCLRQRRRRRV